MFVFALCVTEVRERGNGILKSESQKAGRERHEMRGVLLLEETGWGFGLFPFFPLFFSFKISHFFSIFIILKKFILLTYR